MMARVDNDYTDWLNAEQNQEQLEQQWRETLARQILLQNGWVEKPADKQAA